MPSLPWQEGPPFCLTVAEERPSVYDKSLTGVGVCEAARGPDGYAEGAARVRWPTGWCLRNRHLASAMTRADCVSKTTSTTASKLLLLVRFCGCPEHRLGQFRLKSSEPTCLQGDRARGCVRSSRGKSVRWNTSTKFDQFWWWVPSTRPTAWQSSRVAWLARSMTPWMLALLSAILAASGASSLTSGS